MMALKVFLLVCLLVATTVAFRAPVSSRYSMVSKSSLSMKSNNAAKVATGMLAFLLCANPMAPAMAAPTTTNFWGKTFSEVLDPNSAEFNEELKNSDEVKQGFAALNEFKAAVKTIQEDLKKDGQIELNQRIKKELTVNKVRAGLNKYNAAFSEDTQRGTDRLIRAILQDLTELDRETQVKPGKARADTKIKTIQKRLTATADALNELAAFAKQ